MSLLLKKKKIKTVGFCSAGLIRACKSTDGNCEYSRTDRGLSIFPQALLATKPFSYGASFRTVESPGWGFRGRMITVIGDDKTRAHSGSGAAAGKAALSLGRRVRLGCRSQGSSTQLERLWEGPASCWGSRMPGGGGQRELSTGASDSGVSDLL